jgi:hypothetical protein
VDTLAENADRRSGDVCARKPRSNAGALNCFGDCGAFDEADFDFRRRAGQCVDDRDGDLAHAA